MRNLLFLVPFLFSLKRPIIPKRLFKSKDYINEKSLVYSHVDSDNNKQTLSLYALRKHNFPCKDSLELLSRYEIYKNLVSVISHSTYDEKMKRLQLTFSSSYLTKPLHLDFILPRILKDGTYPFTFKKGIFPGLLGEISVRSSQNYCHYSLKIWWKGEKSFFSDSLLQVFSSTIVRLGIESLLRKAKSPPPLFK